MSPDDLKEHMAKLFADDRRIEELEQQLAAANARTAELEKLVRVLCVHKWVDGTCKYCGLPEQPAAAPISLPEHAVDVNVTTPIEGEESVVNDEGGGGFTGEGNLRVVPNEGERAESTMNDPPLDPEKPAPNAPAKRCPNCSSDNVDCYDINTLDSGCWKCLSCGYEWDDNGKAAAGDPVCECGHPRSEHIELSNGGCIHEDGNAQCCYCWGFKAKGGDD